MEIICVPLELMTPILKNNEQKENKRNLPESYKEKVKNRRAKPVGEEERERLLQIKDLFE